VNKVNSCTIIFLAGNFLLTSSSDTFAVGCSSIYRLKAAKKQTAEMCQIISRKCKRHIVPRDTVLCHQLFLCVRLCNKMMMMMMIIREMMTHIIKLHLPLANQTLLLISVLHVCFIDVSGPSTLELNKGGHVSNFCKQAINRECVERLFVFGRWIEKVFGCFSEFTGRNDSNRGIYQQVTYRHNIHSIIHLCWKERKKEKKRNFLKFLSVNADPPSMSAN